MKYLFITALAACISTTAFAQEKKEATVKIVINENGKERIIEKKFSDLDQADAELKKLSDSLDINVTTSGGKKKIVRVDVNKSHSRMSDQPGNVIIEKIEGGAEGGADKRVIIRRGGPGMAPGAPGAHGAHGGDANVMIFRGEGGPDGVEKEFNIELDGPMGGPMKGLKMLKALGEGNGSKTIHGLSGEQNQPFNGKLNVHFTTPTKGNVTIAVSDVNGKEIATETVKDFQGEYLGQIDLKKAAVGVYFLRVTQGNDGAVRRVEVK
ncbi:T9SS type A sorting domain-containing protein [Aquirufa sp. HETE-83D]|uniref:T9SS type A sorting domain-containing protein n=1 Tax=Aquirufa esocilacus TaxID=3096513 RepID=A0ABW6DED3_9BACT